MGNFVCKFDWVRKAQTTYPKIFMGISSSDQHLNQYAKGGRSPLTTGFNRVKMQRKS